MMKSRTLQLSYTMKIWQHKATTTEAKNRNRRELSSNCVKIACQQSLIYLIKQMKRSDYISHIHIQQKMWRKHEKWNVLSSFPSFRMDYFSLCFFLHFLLEKEILLLFYFHFYSVHYDKRARGSNGWERHLKKSVKYSKEEN